MGLMACVLLMSHLLLRPTVGQANGTTPAVDQDRAQGKVLTSSNFPNGYFNNEHKEQRLSVPEGYEIEITFQEFELEKSSSCVCDYVKICDGNKICGTKLCGSSLPDPITVSTSTATVVFHSDHSITKKGFSLTYRKISQGHVPDSDRCKVHIGKSLGKHIISGTVPEGCVCPAKIDKSNWLGGIPHNYEFEVTQDGTSLVVKRTDQRFGWTKDFSFMCRGTCQTGKGMDYSGAWTGTKSGRTCRQWNSITDHPFPRVAHNYCRNPYSKYASPASGVWCFTTDPNKRWELCDVPECGINTLDPNRKNRQIRLSADKLEAYGYFAVQSVYPMYTLFASGDRLEYFEMKIFSLGTVIGLATHYHNLINYPGRLARSYGYATYYANGPLFITANKPTKYGASFYLGDTVGCGMNRTTGRLFFTKNGEHLGEVFTVPDHDTDDEYAKLYPTFYMNTHFMDSKVQVNLGNKPFLWKKKSS